MRTSASRVMAALVMAAVIVGCGTSNADPAPTVQEPASSAQADLVAGRRAAGIADCPEAAVTSTTSLPDLELACLGGPNSVNLSKLPTGKGWVINVWAQWCGPCRDEAPFLAEVYRRHEKQLNFLGIDYNDPRPELAIAFAGANQLTYPHLVDDDHRIDAPLRINGIPQTLFIDASGRIVGRHVGPVESAAQLEQALRDVGLLS